MIRKGGVGNYDRLPEAKRAVGDREFRALRQPASLQVKEEFAPGLCALAHAVDQPDQLLLTLGRGPDDHQQALRCIFQPGLHVDAVAQ